MQKLARGGLDLALIVLPEGGTDPALVAEPILRERLVVASSAAKPGEAEMPLEALRATTLSPPGVKRTIALAHRRDVTPTHAARAWRHVLHAYLTEAAAWSRLPSGVETI